MGPMPFGWDTKLTLKWRLTSFPAYQFSPLTLLVTIGMTCIGSCPLPTTNSRPAKILRVLPESETVPLSTILT